MIYATVGNDTYIGGGGTDTLSYVAISSAVTLHLDTNSSTDAGGDSTSISGFSVYALGNAANDTVYGSSGNDSVLGGSGNNTFYATTGSDTLNGGVGGTNTINFSGATVASNINLTTGTTTGYASDTVSNFTTIVGSSHGDTIKGSAGADSITGGAGNDYFVATTGNDTYAGGGGASTLDYSGLAGTETATLTGSSASIIKSAGGTDSASSTTSIIGGSGSNSFTLDTSALASFSSIDGGSSGTSLATVNDTASADTSVNTQMSSLFTHIGSLDLSGLTLAGDSWGSNITGSEVFNMLGGAYGTLELTVKSGSNLETTIGSMFADNGTFTSHVTSAGTTTWSDGGGHNVAIHVTAV